MKVIKETLYLPRLDREATLYVGLPNHYEAHTQAYPVLYMHDGQNLFFKEDSAYGHTWEVKEAFEADPSLPECIVVGLSCAEGFDRLDEYGPYPFTFAGFNAPRALGGRADAYLDTLIHDIMPNIETTYRVKTGKEHTAMMGSSMGGVISLYAAIKYPGVIGRVASVSGAFYVSLEAFEEAFNQADFAQLETFYMDTGDDEVGGGKPHHYLESNERVYEVIKPRLKTKKHHYALIPGGKHHETDWAKRFPDIVRFLWS